MRPVKSGETCSIVSTTDDIVIEQVAEHTATVDSAVSGTITVDSTEGFVNAGVAINGAIVFRYTGKTATSATRARQQPRSRAALTWPVTIPP